MTTATSTRTSTRTSKRIRKVVVKHMVDTNPDTSHLGEYSSKSTSQYSIDRAHALDCPINTHEVSPDHVDSSTEDCFCVTCTGDDCTCGEHGDMERHQYRYFNPSFNYVRKDGTLCDGLTPDEVRKYVRQDYDRMKGLNDQQWWYMGIRAEAQIRLTPEGPIQEITSGGLWGIESDSERSYFVEVEQEELSELRKQLEALGFSKRAVTAAFRDVEHKDE